MCVYIYIYIYSAAPVGADLTFVVCAKLLEMLL